MPQFFILELIFDVLFSNAGNIEFYIILELFSSRSTGAMDVKGWPWKDFTLALEFQLSLLIVAAVQFFVFYENTLRVFKQSERESEKKGPV